MSIRFWRAKRALECGGLTPLSQKSSDWYSRSDFHNITASAVVLGSRSAAAVVSRPNRHRCEDQTCDENKGRADR
jgi:hypothetical protein